MKTRELIRLLERKGWVFVRHGANHDVYKKGDAIECVPRHRELSELLAKDIIRRRGL